MSILRDGAIFLPRALKKCGDVAAEADDDAKLSCHVICAMPVTVTTQFKPLSFPLSRRILYYHVYRDYADMPISRVSCAR